MKPACSPRLTGFDNQTEIVDIKLLETTVRDNRECCIRISEGQHHPSCKEHAVSSAYRGVFPYHDRQGLKYETDAIAKILSQI